MQFLNYRVSHYLDDSDGCGYLESDDINYSWWCETISKYVYDINLIFNLNEKI